MALKYPTDKYPSIRFFIGDVRNKARLVRAFENIEIMIHTAAMKNIQIAEAELYAHILHCWEAKENERD